MLGLTPDPDPQPQQLPLSSCRPLHSAREQMVPEWRWGQMGCSLVVTSFGAGGPLAPGEMR